MVYKNIPSFSYVEMIVNNQHYKGVLQPEDGNKIILKLSSGYNIAFDKKHVEKITLIKENKMEQKKESTKDKFNKDSIVIIHTGGTISSKVDYKTGAVIASFDPKSLLNMFPELNKIQSIESEFIGNIMSDNFRLHHFNLMASAIHKRVIKGQRKFIVTSGTDFLHYASAALSFLLKDLPIKVMVVGSQRSSDRPSSDAAQNIVNAAYFLENSEFHGVGVCMHTTSSHGDCDILPGVNVRKMHSSRRDAFKPINGEKIAVVNYTNKSITMQKELKTFIQNEIPKKIPLFNENLKIGILYSHPQFYAEELSTYENFDGLVLAGSGFGHFPIIDDVSKEHAKILKQITKLAKKMPVVMSVQTISGGVNLNVYTPLRMIEEAGVIGHLSSMITETAFIKLAYLISTCKKEDVKELFMTNILGEIQPEKYFQFQD